MDDKKTDASRIAEEAVGERPGSATPDAAKKKSTTEQVIRQAATSVGSEASVAAKSAEAVGERGGGAYAHPNATTAEVQKRSRNNRPVARQTGSPLFGEQTLVRMVGVFALGYAAALLIHQRR